MLKTLLAFQRVFMLFIIEWKGSKVRRKFDKVLTMLTSTKQKFESVNVKIFILFKATFCVWKFNEFLVSVARSLIKIDAKLFTSRMLRNSKQMQIANWLNVNTKFQTYSIDSKHWFAKWKLSFLSRQKFVFELAVDGKVLHEVLPSSDVSNLDFLCEARVMLIPLIWI